MSDIQKDRKDIISKRTDLNLQSNFNDFFKNNYHTYAVLKAEKLASALYIVSNFIPENDPLRQRLRTQALDVVALTSSTQWNFENISSRILELGTLLSAAERAGLISAMNAKILSEEYAALAKFLQKHASDVGDTVDTMAHLSNTEKSVPQSDRKEKDTYTHKPLPKKTYKRHNDRKEAILSLIGKDDTLSIKDIASSIKGCSEKTIQRELTALVAEGVLIKEGERRWSTYRLPK
jgi:hypothetical protein